jgi:DNA mismatch repair protein MutS2
MSAAFHLDPQAAKDTGFDELMTLLRARALSPYGREAMAEDVFPAELDLRARVADVDEAMRACQRGVAPDFGAIHEVRHILDAASKDTVLATIDLVEAGRTIDACGRLRDVLLQQGREAPRLVDRAMSMHDERRLSRRWLRSIDDAGLLVDDASQELGMLRSRVRVLRQEAHDKLHELVRDYDDVGVLQDRNFTIRSDRYVLPVKSEFQARVEGIVHDASQSHATVFIEPRMLLQLGNRIKMAQADVFHEEQRILREFSQELAEVAHALVIDLQIAGAIEAAFVRAGFGVATDGCALMPAAADAAPEVREARHPLLAWWRAQDLATGKAPRALVANDIGFAGRRVLVISGPNAGGKTVALKTLGLVSLCVRAGIPVPVDPHSVVPLWQQVLVCMGDEQSIEGALSSFSGHLRHVARVVEQVEQLEAARRGASASTGAVLCLLDELMSGTDPTQGAALAQAVLERLAPYAFVVTTTHHDRLKALAADGAHGLFRNASVGMHAHSGRPTFRLLLDTVGTANAFDTAAQFGLPHDVVVRAQALMAPEALELHGLLKTLQEQRAHVVDELDAARLERAALQQQTARLQQRERELEGERQRLRRDARKIFADEVKEARDQVDEWMRQAAQRDERALQQASQGLKQIEKQARAQAAAPAQDSGERPAKVAITDVVGVASMPGARFEVVAIHGNEVEVARGLVRMRVAMDALRTIEQMPNKTKRQAPSKTTTRTTEQGSTTTVSSGVRTSDNSLDVRGQRVDDALEMVDGFVDRLLRASADIGFVLHGHGSGALKKAVREALARHASVQTAQPATHDDGGDAWTAITLRG